MGVRIEAKAGHHLQLTGDIETVLDVPARGLSEGFSLAFSDGTLVRGTWHIHLCLSDGENGRCSDFDR